MPEEFVKTIVFVRHGETALTRDGNRFCGDLEPELTTLGQAQALRAREILSDLALAPNAFWTSPRRRAESTARLIFPAARWQVVEDLRELSFGAWEGLTKQEAQAAAPRAYALWEQDAYLNSPPGGESGKAARPRIDRALDAISASAARTILIVSHITYLRLFIGLLMDIPPAEIRQRLDVQTARIGIIEITARKGKLKALNI